MSDEEKWLRSLNEKELMQEFNRAEELLRLRPLDFDSIRFYETRLRFIKIILKERK